MPMTATSIEDLFDHNRKWAAQVERERPGFFTSLMEQQNPRYMWIGCSDSRVPANQITGLEPGEVFVHRNIANVVIPTDLNCLSTIQYAVDQLHIQHLMVVGHYGCGGVLAALNDIRVGLSDNWIQHVKDVRDKHRKVIAATAPEWRHDVLCELNAIEQVLNIAHTTVMQDAWTRGEKVIVHGWCYGLKDGLIKNLNMSVSSKTGLYDIYDAAVLGVAAAQR